MLENVPLTILFQNYTENRRVVNLIQDWCDACREAAWASLDPNNERRW